MQTYLVGGAVRDHLLGVESKDRDYVVVGSSPEELLSLGYKQVGSNFPVFLHPETGDEYALARREKKSGSGYNGFQVEFGKDVTLEEDLSRRDLTINAMAMMDDGTIVDPFGGQKDLAEGILRHVSEAFAEDPLRVLRVARFVARYGFRVDLDTFMLCFDLVESGELQHLTPERVWKEFSRMLEEKHFEDGYEFLINTHAFLKCGPLAELMTMTDEQYNSHDDARPYTVNEKALFYTTVDAKDVSFVPNDLTAAVRRLQFLYRLAEAETVDLEKVQKFVDQNRAHLTATEFREEVRTFVEIFKDLDKTRSAFERLVAAADAVYALDFTTLLNGVPKDRIKEVVREHKMNAIKEVFA